MTTDSVGLDNYRQMVETEQDMIAKACGAGAVRITPAKPKLKPSQEFDLRCPPTRAKRAAERTGFSVKDILRFTDGDCWVMALTIHRLTGWPMVSIGGYHLVVKTPEGTLLDITGEHSVDDMLEIWGGDPLGLEHDYTIEAAKKWGVKYGAYSYLRARLLFPRVIALMNRPPSGFIRTGRNPLTAIAVYH